MVGGYCVFIAMQKEQNYGVLGRTEMSYASQGQQRKQQNQTTTVWQRRPLGWGVAHILASAPPMPLVEKREA